MRNISRKSFLTQISLSSVSLFILSGCGLWRRDKAGSPIGFETPPKAGEDIVSYIQRVSGRMDMNLYRKILGAANAFKEGDHALGVAARNETVWDDKGSVDHNISRVVSGISDTALGPEEAVAEVVNMLEKMYTNS